MKYLCNTAEFFPGKYFSSPFYHFLVLQSDCTQLCREINLPRFVAEMIVQVKKTLKFVE